VSHKRILFRSAARERILHGATTLADAVRVTLGPKSKCVLIGRKWGPPLVCNDGVTIVKEIDLEDPEENLGAHMLREAAERTADVVGDGTTTATLLAHAILAAGLKNLAAGASAVDLKRGLDRGARLVVETIRGLSRPVASRQEKAQVATLSAHNDAALGEFVADAMERVGSEGVVTVEEAKGIETSIEVVDGMRFDRGLLSPYFVTDAERQEAVLEKPLILLHEAKIAGLERFLPFLEAFLPTRRPLVVIAESVEAEALATLVVNRLRGVLACVAVKAPGYGDRRRDLMQDMAVLTGGKFISADLGVTLDAVKPADLGSAARVTVDRDAGRDRGGDRARRWARLPAGDRPRGPRGGAGHGRRAHGAPDPRTGARGADPHDRGKLRGRRRRGGGRPQARHGSLRLRRGPRHLLRSPGRGHRRSHESAAGGGGERRERGRHAPAHRGDAHRGRRREARGRRIGRGAVKHGVLWCAARGCHHDVAIQPPAAPWTVGRGLEAGGA
jgi:hypothetical protein